MYQLLDQSKTAPFSLGPALTEARARVLLIHGFTGSPWEMRPLGEALAAHGFHARGLRLPGHGTSPEEMLWVTWRDWLETSEREFTQLSAAGPVVLVGHSMGALLALLVAARHPERLAGLVLLAPAMRLQGLNASLVRPLRHLPLEWLRRQWQTKESTDLENDEIRAEAPITPRYPNARVFDLFALQDLAREALPFIHQPSLIVTAAHDHVVDNSGAAELARTLPGVKAVTLQRGFHIVTRDNDRARLVTEVLTYLDAHAAPAASRRTA